MRASCLQGRVIPEKTAIPENGSLARLLYPG
nr:MAG TPA: hypothetical protein [Caudoviricetes sp.]